MINTKQPKPPSLYTPGIITGAVSMTMINEQQKRRGQTVICKLGTELFLVLGQNPF